MRVEIKPSALQGTVTAPPSKSMAHRLLICAGLSEGESVVRRLAFSQDVKATIDCLRALGAEIRLDGDTAFVKGTDARKAIGKTAVLNCNECGSTLRFFTPLCMLSGEERVLRGSPYLMTRPMDVYEKITRDQGIRFEKAEDHLTVEGKLQSGVYEVAGNISSQFISGLLFTLPLLGGDSEIRILPPVESKPYIDMTVAALRQYGIEVEASLRGARRECRATWQSQPLHYRIKGNQSYCPADVTVEGDYSSAAFFEALNYAGSSVKIDGLRENTLQGDSVYKILFENIKNGIDPINIADCPDLGPVLFAVAALCGGARFTGTRRLRIKESDRADAMRQELQKLGVDVEVGENEVIVHGGTLRQPTEVLSAHGDHRIVMALSVLLTVTGGVIDGAQAVNKSFPDFFEKLQKLGAEVQIYGMDQ
ncbi:3-phosphoshikimate 1-carboxyvinyltransferase [Ruminococcus sp.]|uniref:3-phosphoshikimate 1-carboxyvinyltransferase n=1 Tax=Ruminococcus sp. TaxID=41978 RepID=UPI002E810F8E|nr:3-phosphoshikimate 1-carboxyvinyltransferase [Ruminococcus sp.]MEE3492455.1 3-phosphoshikimate 1-carboxyvinyltransferase [Ruminococcus sp.]